MTRISVGAAVGAGFQLIARRPLAVLAWGAVMAAMQAAAMTLLAPYYVAIYGPMLGRLAGGAAAAPPAAGFSPLLLQFEALAQLLNLMQLFVVAVLYCAVFRAVLHPERSAFAYLRVGFAELFMIVFVVAAVIAFVVGALVLGIPLGILAGVLAALTHAGGAALALVALVPLVLLVVAVVLALRFAFVGPMIVDEDKFRLVESWRATRGRMGSLLQIALALVGVIIALDVLVVVAMMALGAGGMAALGGIQAAMALARQSPQALIARLWPFLAGYAALLVPIGGATLAVLGAPWARAYLDLKADTAEAFA